MLFRGCVGLLAGLGLIAACSNSNPVTDGGGSDATTDTAPVTCMPPFGGPVMGMADMHCKDDAGMDIVQSTDPNSCHPPPDAGMPPMEDYGETMNGSEGDDDDCKYHLKWSSTNICQNGETTFTITVTKKADGMPALGANPYTETVLGSSHLAGGNPTTKEMGNGVYTIGPVIFDQPGKWYVRFHMYGDCEDILEDTPHGHAAFYVDVP